MSNKAAFLLRTVYYALDYKLRNKRRPINVSLTLTSRCNLKCKYCYADAYLRKTKDYAFDEIKTIIDEFISIGTQIFMLQGGEPLLYKDIGKVIKHIKSRGRYCSMNTNGVLIDKRIDDIAGIDKVVLSIDGSREVNDSMRGAGVYDKVMANIDLLKSRGIPFMFHAVLTQKSTLENSVLPVLELAKKHGTMASLCNATETGTGDNQQQSVLSPALEHYRMLAGEILRLIKEGYPVSNSEYFWQHVLDWPLNENDIGTKDNLPHGFKYIKCAGGRLTAWVDAEGVLYPCPSAYFKPEFRASIKEHGGVRGAWEKLGSIPCEDCLSIGESTPLFSFRLGQLKTAFAYLRKKS